MYVSIQEPSTEEETNLDDNKVKSTKKKDTQKPRKLSKVWNVHYIIIILFQLHKTTYECIKLMEVSMYQCIRIYYQCIK